MYVGLGLAGAMVETLLRNPARKMAAYADIASRASSEVRCARDLRLARLHGAGLQQLGTDNAISTGPYGPCGAWADALFAHPDTPDGIAYHSRHDPDEICVAIFERRALPLMAGGTVRLLDQLPTVSSVLTRYGKSVGLAPSLSMRLRLRAGRGGPGLG
jgi:hypothetical protein